MGTITIRAAPCILSTHLSKSEQLPCSVYTVHSPIQVGTLAHQVLNSPILVCRGVRGGVVYARNNVKFKSETSTGVQTVRSRSNFDNDSACPVPYLVFPVSVTYLNIHCHWWGSVVCGQKWNSDINTQFAITVCYHSSGEEM